MCNPEQVDRPDAHAPRGGADAAAGTSGPDALGDGGVDPGQPLGGTAREVGELVLHLAQELNDVLARCTAEEELTVSEARALSYVRERPMSNRELASLVGCDAPRATVLVKRLAARGLVDRPPSRGDRRVRPVAITGEGEAVVARIGNRLARSSPLMAALEHQDLLRLRDLLSQVRDSAAPRRSS